MALNLDKMKKKLETLKSNGAGGASAFWKPQEGEQTIRILSTEDGDPFKDYHFHYVKASGRTNSVMCPKRNFGEDCPICEFASSLWEESKNGSSNAEASATEAKKLFAKQRFFSPVVVRGQEDNGPKVWGFSKTIYEQLLSAVCDPDYGDITDPQEGNDIRLTYGRSPNRLFPETKITVRPIKTTLTEDEDKTSALLTTIPDFSTLFEQKSTADVQEILNQYMVSEDAEDSPDVVTQNEGGIDSIEKSFNDLLSA